MQRRANAAGLATTSFSSRTDLDAIAVRRLRRAITAFAPDIVHAHDARAHATALLALLGSAVPLVVTRRVTFGQRSRFKYGARVSRFVAISRAVAASLERGGVPRRRISVVHSGVPPAEALEAIDWRERYAWPAATVVCGMAGAMTREKGVADLAEIARSLPGEIARRCRLVLIGGEASPELIDLAGLQTAAAGFLDEPRAGIAGLDILWHPARSEGLGTILLDAMAFGVPQVAYNVGGIPEVLRHGETGLLVPADQPRLFAEAVTVLIQESSLRSKLGAGARERARYFSVDRMAEGNLEVYNRVLSGSRKSRQ